MPGENKLAGERSPYLLQHAGNPVNWYPWCEEAFTRAKEDDKPIFLSIGYSACHWCHVMARECFEDEEVAALLNDACVSIKVDREERPDLDALFMEICQIQNGSGGWPLNLFLTPDGEPFFAATFLPKRTIGKMPGLADVTPRVKWLWMMQRDDVMRGAKSLTETLAAKLACARGGRVSAFQAKSALKDLKNTFDGFWGGFGFAPKAPCAPKLLFLLKYARAFPSPEHENKEILSMVDLTLRKMWAGGIHDHLGGGYARYSTDERWVVPHFEKMLCDQAMLLWVAASAYEAGQDGFYQKFAEDVAGCILRDFTSQESCFWTSWDADSDGGEGKFYLWTEDEIRSLLPQGDAGLFCAIYAILPGGNFTHEMTGMQMGQNVLYEALSYTDAAKRYGLRAPDVVKRLENDRRILFEARNMRPKPHVDEKVLMDWNGLTIGALAYAGRVFEKKEWILSAERAALFLQKVLVDPKGAWRRRYVGKEAAVAALPGDYAALMWGVLELYKSASMEKQKKDWLKYAETLAAKLEDKYWDEDGGGFFLSADDPRIFLRRKTAADDAAPSANAMAMMAYTVLERAFPENQKYKDKVRAINTCFARAVNLRPVDHISMVMAVLEQLSPPAASAAAADDAPVSDKPEKPDKPDKKTEPGRKP